MWHEILSDVWSRAITSTLLSSYIFRSFDDRYVYAPQFVCVYRYRYRYRDTEIFVYIYLNIENGPGQ